jgi:signal transduction histidine kinase
MAVLAATAGSAAAARPVGVTPPAGFPAAPCRGAAPVFTVVGVTSDLLRPWREPETWWRLTHLVLGALVGTVSFTAMVVLLALSVSLLITFPLALPCAWLLFVVARAIGHVERSRFGALLGVGIDDPVPPLQGTTLWRRLVERVRSRPRWREIGYGVVRLPLGLVTMLVALVAWCGSAALLALPLYVGTLPGGTAKFGLFEASQGVTSAGAALVGLAGMALAPWVTGAMAALDAAAARRLLGPRPSEAADARVARLETSRAAALDSAEAERRRIERDLHDGAQQRLVALAMDLGHARERLETDPEGGRQLVVEAHEEAKAALKDIRDLVRGIHPVILEDRGLDAALSAVVARSPVPVRLEVDVAPRPPAAIESTAYFVVAESLTNVARHAGATGAHVTIVREGDRLVIEVRDDGGGGADPERGTGLRGLRDRVTAHGGTMHVMSPSGGPTTVLVEIPCGSAERLGGDL